MALVDQLLKTYITFPQSLLAPFIKKPSYVDRYGSYSHVLNKFSTHSSTIKYSLLTDIITTFSTISTVLITMSTELINKGFNNIYEINR